jgi:hypothetical protein
MKNYEYPGAVHIHSTFSDGTLSIDDIIKEARKEDLRWIIITDHNTIEGLEKGCEGFYGNLCVLVGTEISPHNRNHYLAFDVKSNISQELPPEKFIQKVNEQGGFGFIAHPDESTERKNHYPPLRWENWDINGFQGIEIWNYMSDWVDTLTEENKFKMFFQPEKYLQGPTVKVMQWWDDLNSRNCNIVPALIGLDVHQFLYNFMGLKLRIFPYGRMFKTLKNYIQIDDCLSTDFETAKKQIYTALRAGNNIMINEYLGKGNGVIFTVSKINPDHSITKITVGESLTVSDEFTLDIQTPSVCNIKLFCNGEVIEEQVTDRIKLKCKEPGTYRFEAFKNNQHWIITNPVKVLKEND